MLVGVTGNLGSGKSLLMRNLARHGYATFDADDIVEALYRDANVISQLEAAFGEEIVKDGAVDRKALSSKVFSSPPNLRKLNNMVHPLVADRIAGIKHDGMIVFVEVPLLFESRMQGMFSRVILLRASHEACMRRAAKRGLPGDEFEKRVASQYAADRISSSADFVVDSECSPVELSEKAEAIICELEKLRK